MYLKKLLNYDQNNIQISSVLKMVLAFLMVFVIIFTYSFLNKDLQFVGDAYESWEVAKAFFDSEYQYRSFVEYRGQLPFFLYSLIYNLSVFFNTDEILTYRFFSSLLFTILTVVSLPYLFSKILNFQISPIKRLVFSLTVFYFFRGYFLYPSNDYFAFFFLVLAVNSILKSETSYLLHYGFTGFYVACAFFFRSNYVVSVPIIVFLIYLKTPASFSWVLAKKLVFFLTSIFLMFELNSFLYEYRERTDGAFAQSYKAVVTSQLLHSLYWQKVEWNAGDKDYPGTLRFLDSRGETIMDIEDVDVRLGYLPVATYFNFVLRYPIDFLTKYVRHFFSGMDIVYPEIYVTDLHQSRVLFSFLNYTLIFIALFENINMFIKPSPIRGLWMIVFLTLTAPALVTIPMIIEPRFFFPMLLTLHGLAVFDLRLPKDGIRSLIFTERFQWLMITYVFFIVVCFTMSASSFEQLEGPVILFHPR